MTLTLNLTLTKNLTLTQIDFVYKGFIVKTLFLWAFLVYVSDEDCGRTVFTGSTGIVTSPRFPLYHPRRLDCVYFFDVDRTKITTFTFISFNLEGISRDRSSDYCSHSWLTVSA